MKKSNPKDQPWLIELTETYVNGRGEVINLLSNKKLQLKKTVHVAGLETSFLDSENSEIILDKLLKEQVEEEALRSKLEESGITPIAILPKNVFEDMIEGLPFYTFRNINEKGEVKASLSNYTNPISGKIPGLLGIVSILVSLFATFWISYFFAI